MKKSRFNETQIISILKKQQAGLPVLDIYREHGISQDTFFNWKSKYGRMNVNNLKGMKKHEAENAKLKRMYADMSLTNEALIDLIEKKALRPAQKRESVDSLNKKHKLSVRQACILLNISSLIYHFKPIPRKDQAIVA